LELVDGKENQDAQGRNGGDEGWWHAGPATWKIVEKGELWVPATLERGSPHRGVPKRVYKYKLLNRVPRRGEGGW